MTTNAARPEPGSLPTPLSGRHTVVGIRMTAEREVEVKVEAARRGMSVASLFDDMWRRYAQGRPG